MRCPYCSQDRDKVIDSRSAEGGRAIRRRRHCLDCQRRFTTYEHIEEYTRLTVIKKDGTRVPYDRGKILAGVEKACYKRPVSAENLQRLVDEVEEELVRQQLREIEAMVIGAAVSERLKLLDHVAYVRFASVYKQFRDLDDFINEVRDVMDEGQADSPGQGKLF